LRCIQLDPLDVIGTNADLVVMARVESAKPGDVWRHLFPSLAFEHFAKERCILPAEAFARYRRHGHAAQTPWWRHQDREDRLPPRVIRAVLEEVRRVGPVTARNLTDHGSVDPLDWSGWMGTAKATTMALEFLWTRCDIVVCGRTESGARLYDVPERSLIGGAGSSVSVLTEKDELGFHRWALLERVRAAGLLSRAGGSTWSMLGGVRTSPLPDEMLTDGDLVEVGIEGSPRRYLTLPGLLRKRSVHYDNRVRILAPLDPLIWDRQLVRSVFEFEYVWEVYKPEHLRRWGWYVCPLLHRDQLVGRMDARIAEGILIVKKVWVERELDSRLLHDALERHAQQSGCSGIRMSRSALRHS